MPWLELDRYWIYLRIQWKIKVFAGALETFRGMVWRARRAHGRVVEHAYQDQSVPRRANPYQCKANRLEYAMCRRLWQVLRKLCKEVALKSGPTSSS